jgi:alanyl-tRNA synthetase
VRDQPGIDAVALVGVAAPGKVALTVAATKASGLDARAAIGEAARAVGGGGGGSPELATAGGREVDRVDVALALLRTALGDG